MIKITALFLATGIASCSAIAVNNGDVLNEIVEAAEFAALFEIASKEANRTGFLTAAILTPAAFGFDKIPKSIGVSMVNAHVKNFTSQYTNSTIAIYLAPVICDGLAALAARAFGLNHAATLLGKKAGYALTDISLCLTGSNAAAALAMLRSAMLAQHAGLHQGVITILYENAGALIGDAVYSLLSLYGGTVVTGYVSDACIAILLLSVDAVAAGGETALAIASGLALSSFFALLQSINQGYLR